MVLLSPLCVDIIPTCIISQASLLVGLDHVEHRHLPSLLSAAEAYIESIPPPLFSSHLKALMVPLMLHLLYRCVYVISNMDGNTANSNFIFFTVNNPYPFRLFCLLFQIAAYVAASSYCRSMC